MGWLGSLVQSIARSCPCSGRLPSKARGQLSHSRSADTKGNMAVSEVPGSEVAHCRCYRIPLARASHMASSEVKAWEVRVWTSPLRVVVAFSLRWALNFLRLNCSLVMSPNLRKHASSWIPGAGQRAERFRSVDKTHGSRLYAVGGVQISCHLTTKATLLVPLRPCSPGCLGIGSFGPRLLSSCLLYESFHFLSF